MPRKMVLATVASLAVAAACSSFEDAPDVTAVDAGVDAASPSDGAPQGMNDGAVDAGDASDASLPRSVSYRAAVLASAPVAYWRMGTPVDVNKITNEVNASNRLHLFGAYEAGAGLFEDDPAIVFDGTSVFGTATTSTPFAFPAKQPFTLEVWARHDGNLGTTTYEHLLSYVEGTGGTEQQNGYILYLRNDTAPRIAASLDSLDASAVQAEFAAEPDGAWAHYVYVYDGTQIRLYIDGVLRDTKPTSAVQELRMMGAFTVGTGSNDTARFFHGALDEIAVYPIALSQQTIEDHYALGRSP